MAHPNQQDLSQMWQMGTALSSALKTFMGKKGSRTGETYPNALTQEKINMRSIKDKYEEQKRSSLNGSVMQDSALHMSQSK